MKNLILSFAFIGASIFGVQAQQALNTGPDVEFEKDIHDFGTLTQGGNASTEFMFTNTGSEPLIISNARGSCGCTVPSWPKQPIKPGETSSIKVKYDSNRIGPINKSVTITSNAGNEPTKVLRIKGNITAKDVAPAVLPVKEATPGAPINN